MMYRLTLLLFLLGCSMVAKAATATLFYYTPAYNWSTVYVHHDAYGSWTTAPGEPMLAVCADWVGRRINLGTRSSFQAVFNNGGGRWDNPGQQPGTNYVVGSGISRVVQGQLLTGTTAPCPAPAAPQGLNAPASGITASSIRLQWTAPAGPIQRYSITRDGTLIGTSTGPSYTVNGLQAATAYTFRVLAENVVGQRSAWSSPLVVTTAPEDHVPPTVPAGLQVAARSADTMALRWTAASDTSGIRAYKVFRNQQLAGTVTGTRFYDLDLQPATRYSYTVLAEDKAGNVSSQSAPLDAQTLPAGPRVADNSTLKTWWHANAEANETTPVADGNVRQSTHYSVRVSSKSALQNPYDAFVYMSIPRGGRQKWGYSNDDGAEYASQAGWSMSWSTFLYAGDAVVDVTLPAGTSIRSASEVSVRPGSLNLKKEMLNARTVRIHVPWTPDGMRFSVEFAGQMQGSYQTPSGQLSASAQGNTLVHEAPRHALLIFAEPQLTAEQRAELIPSSASGGVYYPAPGQLTQLDSVQEPVIHFRPGTYYMPWNYRASLSPKVRWIYLEPGAYIKGAFLLPAGQAEIRITGYGVLSGEKYVYEADTANGYQHRSASSNNCWASCVKMLQFSPGSTGQTLVLHGLTINEPPYHSFVAYGNEQQFRMDVSHYKQVGGWYWQTDGLELYPGSTLSHAFLHSNDDVIKLYHSNVRVNNVVVWKGENGPVVQWGWKPRSISDVHLDGLHVIHNFMHWSGTHNLCILNSARSYLDDQSMRLGDARYLISGLTLENIRVEGKSACAMRFYAMSGWRDITIRNLSIDAWNGLDSNSFAAMSDAAGVPMPIGNEMVDGQGLLIENMTVGQERIGKAANNWQSYQAGRLNFDANLWNNWNAW